MTCVVCQRPIVAPQLYVSGPSHAVCKPPARLDVAKVTQAAGMR